MIHVERNGAIVDITRPEGNYRIIYEHHFQRFNPANLPTKTDGFCFETGWWDWSKELPRTFPRKWNNRFDRLVQTLEERRVPIYLTDFSPTKASYFSDSALRAAEMAMAYLLVSKIPVGGYLDFSSSADLLRIGATTALSVWLASPLTTTVLRSILPEKWNPTSELTANLKKLSERFHPEVEFSAGGLREAVIAYKDQWIMKQGGQNYSHLTNLIGGLHVGLEDQLTHSPEEHLDYLKRRRLLLKFAVRTEAFYKIAKYEYRGRKWRLSRVNEIPELKELVA